MIYLIALILLFCCELAVWAQDIKISAFPPASPLAGIEEFPCVQSGVTNKCTVSQTATFTYSLLNGDCTAPGGAITCTKTNGVAFGTFATQNYLTPPPMGPATFTGGLTLSANTKYADLVANNAGLVAYAPVFDVTAFGAVGDGSTVNNTAIGNALTAATAAAGQVRFPCGTFKVTAALSATILSATNLTVMGGGQGCTTILFSGATATGLTFTYGNNYSSATVRDLTITTDQAGAASGTAIHLVSTASGNPPAAPSTLIENVTIVGSDLSSAHANYWLKSIWADNVSNVMIQKSTFAGPTTNGGKMVTVNGNPGATSYAVILSLVDDIFANCGQCIQIGSYFQGLSISNSNFTAGVNAIEVPVSLTGNLDEMVITTSQFGYFTGNIIDLNTLFTDVLVTGCEFAVQPNKTGINGPMTFYNIDGN
jgi:hypothetical protein